MRRTRYPKTVELEIIRHVATQIRKHKGVRTPFDRLYGVSVYKSGICVCSVECAHNEVTVLEHLSNHSWSPKIVSFSLADPDCFNKVVLHVDSWLGQVDSIKRRESILVSTLIASVVGLGLIGAIALFRLMYVS